MTYRDKVIHAMSHALGWDASDLFYGVQIKTNSKDPKTMAKIMAYELIIGKRRSDSRYINFMCSQVGEPRAIMEQALHKTAKEFNNNYEKEFARIN